MLLIPSSRRVFRAIVPWCAQRGRRSRLGCVAARRRRCRISARFLRGIYLLFNAREAVLCTLTLVMCCAPLALRTCAVFEARRGGEAVAVFGVVWSAGGRAKEARGGSVGRGSGVDLWSWEKIP